MRFHGCYLELYVVNACAGRLAEDMFVPAKLQALYKGDQLLDVRFSHVRCKCAEPVLCRTLGGYDVKATDTLRLKLACEEYDFLTVARPIHVFAVAALIRSPPS